MKTLRQATVEPVIGTLVNFLGMRRVNTWGTKLANKCLLMPAACYNLKKLLKWTGENINNTGKTLAKCCFILWLLLVPQDKQSRLAVAVSSGRAKG